MAKRTGNRPPGRAVKIDEDLARKAKIIADTLGVPSVDYLSDLLRPLIARDWPKALRKLEDGDAKPRPASDE